MKVLFHPAALQEFEISVDWYENKRFRLGDKFSSQVFHLISLISNNPKGFQSVAKNKRAVKLKGFPFSIVYSQHEDTIFILAVFHNSRNPQMWKNR